jgi:hypothetical protein
MSIRGRQGTKLPLQQQQQQRDQQNLSMIRFVNSVSHFCYNQIQRFTDFPRGLFPSHVAQLTPTSNPDQVYFGLFAPNHQNLYSESHLMLSPVNDIIRLM